MLPAYVQHLPACHTIPHPHLFCLAACTCRPALPACLPCHWFLPPFFFFLVPACCSRTPLRVWFTRLCPTLRGETCVPPSPRTPLPHTTPPLYSRRRLCAPLRFNPHHPTSPTRAPPPPPQFTHPFYPHPTHPVGIPRVHHTHCLWTFWIGYSFVQFSLAWVVATLPLFNLPLLPFVPHLFPCPTTTSPTCCLPAYPFTLRPALHPYLAHALPRAHLLCRLDWWLAAACCS